MRFVFFRRAEKRLHERKTTGVRVPLGGGVDSTSSGWWNRRSQRASSGCENEFAQLTNDVRAHDVVRSNGISRERGIVDSYGFCAVGRSFTTTLSTSEMLSIDFDHVYATWN